MRFIIATILAFLFISCSGESAHTVDISSGWQYRIGFAEELLDIEKEETASDWKDIDLPVNFNKALNLGKYSGFITIRKELPEDFLQSEKDIYGFALNAGRVLDVSEYYINDKKFATQGSVEPYQSAAMRPFIRSIPQDFLTGQKDYIHIVLYTDGSFPLQIMDKIHFGRSDDIFRQNTNKEVLAFCFLTAYLVYGLYHLLLGYKRPKDIYNIYFGIFCILMSIYWFIANTNTREIIFSDYVVLHRKLEHMAIFLAIPFVLLFVSNFFKKSMGKLIPYYTGFSVLISVLTLLGPLFVMRICMFVWQVTMLLVVLPYTLYYIIKQYKDKHPDAPYFLGGTFLFVFGTGVDILASQNIINLPFISGYVFFSVILGIVFIMAKNFMKVTNGFELLNENLENLVKERTHELNQSLVEVNKLKTQQDGDYFLTSLLVEPLMQKILSPEISSLFEVQIFIQQKKSFAFKSKTIQIGGDICIVDDVYLNKNRCLLFMNADAMGKSMQGAGGILVFGTVFKAAVERLKVRSPNFGVLPEFWLESIFNELQMVFASFNGSMLVSGIIGLVSCKTGYTCFFNAEHPYLILYRDGKASFLENEATMKKIGIDPLFNSFQLQTYQMEAGDALILGSDGKDDISLKIDSVERNINEDETLILESIEKSNGRLDSIYQDITNRGELIDDLSLISLKYLGEPPVEYGEEWQTLLHEEKFSEIETKIQTEAPPTLILQTLVDRYLKEKNYSKANEYMDELIVRKPSNTNLLYLASFVKKKLGFFTIAASYGRSVRMREPKHIMNLINLADIYRLDGATQKSIQILEEALLIEPGEQKALRLREKLLS